MREAAFLEETLEKAAHLVREKYAVRDALRVTSKAEANDLLTEADLATQHLLVDAIRKAFPGDWIVGEEDGFTAFPNDPNARAWVLDPIDGTQNFVRGLFPHFGVSAAFVEGGQAQAGGVILPVTRDLFLAQRGAGARRNGKPIAVSSVGSLGLARVEIDFSTQPDRADTLRRFGRLFVEGGQVRCHCAAVVPLLSVACGEMDVYVHIKLNPWDFAAAQLIVEEAGGVTSRLDGDPASVFDGRYGFAASNGKVHAELLETIAEPARTEVP